MKKKKNSPRDCRNTALKTLAILVLVPTLLMMCLCGIVFRIPEMLKAHSDLQQMKQWKIPPDGHVMDFTTYNSGGGNSCWIVGRLTIESNGSLTAIQEFYNSRYYPKFFGYMIAKGLKIEVLNADSDKKSIHTVEAIKPFNC